MLKLYANIESERAEKGQGGNEFINFELLDKNEIVINSISFVVMEKNVIMLSEHCKPIVFEQICGRRYAMRNVLTSEETTFIKELKGK